MTYFVTGVTLRAVFEIRVWTSRTVTASSVTFRISTKQELGLKDRLTHRCSPSLQREDNGEVCT